MLPFHFLESPSLSIIITKTYLKSPAISTMKNEMDTSKSPHYFNYQLFDSSSFYSFNTYSHRLQTLHFPSISVIQYLAFYNQQTKDSFAYLVSLEVYVIKELGNMSIKSCNIYLPT